MVVGANFAVDNRTKSWYNIEPMPTSVLTSEESRMLYDECVGAMEAVYDRPLNDDPAKSLTAEKRYALRPGNAVKFFWKSEWAPLAILAISFAIALVLGVTGVIAIQQRPQGDPPLFFAVLISEIGVASFGIWLARRTKR
jgi:hypothetical protein